ncbi:hypothetical protein J6590_050165 [Homalodisca vitripennis]|nr:hypothetical protein J6590_050165 [Homalodisca vitripennis]
MADVLTLYDENTEGGLHTLSCLCKRGVEPASAVTPQSVTVTSCQLCDRVPILSVSVQPGPSSE